MTRLIVALAILLPSLSAVHAESVQEAVVGLFKEVCLDPISPEEMLAVAQNTASARGWRLIKLERASIPMMHQENGPPISFFIAWEFDLPNASNVRLMASVVGPEVPDFRFNICGLLVPISQFQLEISNQLDTRIGSALSRKTGSRWVFSRPNVDSQDCRETVSVSDLDWMEPKSTALQFQDLSRLIEGKWRAALPEKWCQP